MYIVKNGSEILRKYCNATWKEIVEHLNSDRYRGLSEEECAARRKAYGDNKINVIEKKSNYIKEFLNLRYILNIAVIAYLACFKEYIMALILFLILIMSIGIKFSNTIKIKKKVEYLKKLNYATITVLRDGVEKIVKSEELVKGDIVHFKKGSLIAADLRVIRVHDVKVDEKNVTGEKFLKEKLESKIDGLITDINEMKNIIFRGSIIAQGEGYGIVVETGANTELGKILQVLNYDNNFTNVDRVFEKYIGKISLVGMLIAILLNLAFNVGNINNSYLMLTLFIIQLVPWGLVDLIYISIVKKRFKKEKVEIFNFSSLFELEKGEVIFLDKIGWISKNRMEVRKVYTNEVLYKEDDIQETDDDNLNKLLEIILLSNNALYDPAKDEGKGDIAEIAYLRFAAKKRKYKSMVDSKYRRIFEVPIDSDKRMFTTLNKFKKGCRANVKGNLEDVLQNCTHILKDGKEVELTKEDIERIKAVNFNLSLEGLITQGVAYRNFSYTPSEGENVESNLVFVGIIALENSLKDNALEEINILKNKEIVPIVFTEDNKITATTLGKRLGIISSNDDVISGVELDSLDEEEFINVLNRVRIFSMVRPEVKARIVSLFREDNYQTITSGETLGELSAIRISNIGISIGEASSMVKQGSDMYIGKEYLKNFISVHNFASNLKNKISNTIKSVILFILPQLVAVNYLKYSNEQYILPLILVNFILMIPITLCILNIENEDINIKDSMIRAIVWSGMLLFALNKIDNGQNIILFSMLSMFFVEYTFVVSKFKVKPITKELLGVLIIAIVLVLFMVYAAISMQLENEFIMVPIMGVIYIGVEILGIKWKNRI